MGVWVQLAASRETCRSGYLRERHARQQINESGTDPSHPS
jgi:hypothetical protein